MDIQSEPKMSSWLGHYTGEPSFPQLFIKNKFIGKADTVLKLIENE